MKVILALITLVALVISFAGCAKDTNEVAAANEELLQAKTAIADCRSEAGVSELDAALLGWDGSPGMVMASYSEASKANQEMHQVKTAVGAAMFDGEVSDIDGSSSTYTWDGRAGQISCGGVDPAQYVNGSFGATYTFSDDGALVGGVLTPSPGKTAWIGVSWDAASGGWVNSHSVQYDAASYLDGKFEATYDVAITGEITEGHNVSWIGIEWDSASLSWAKAP